MHLGWHHAQQEPALNSHGSASAVGPRRLCIRFNRRKCPPQRRRPAALLLRRRERRQRGGGAAVKLMLRGCPAAQHA